MINMGLVNKHAVARTSHRNEYQYTLQKMWYSRNCIVQRRQIARRSDFRMNPSGLFCKHVQLSQYLFLCYVLSTVSVTSLPLGELYVRSRRGARGFDRCTGGMRSSLGGQTRHRMWLGSEPRVFIGSFSHALRCEISTVACFNNSFRIERGTQTLRT